MSDKVKKEEKRVLTMDLSGLKVEARANDDATPGKISGYAAVFNKDSEDMGFIEQIAPGAFHAALKNSDCRALFNHDPNQIIGRSGVNLTLTEDETGLFMEIDPIDTPTFQSVAANIRAGLVTQQSFGFRVKEDAWCDLDTDKPRRTIIKVDELLDVSPVTYPAYPDTDVAVRCLKEQKKDAPMSASDTEPESESPMAPEIPTIEEIDARFNKLNRRII